MLPEATLQRITPVLVESGVDVAYYVTPLPAGLVTAARGGLALLFSPTTTPAERYDRCQRLRFSLMGILPAGHTEMIALNDARVNLAAAMISTGTLVLTRGEPERLRFETMVLSAQLDFEATLARFVDAARRV
jgi:hypothetical protein